MSNKITVLIIHRFPTSSDSFPFISPCSNGWHQAFVKVKVARPTPSDTTDQFFHFFRSAGLLLLSVQFQHLEAMPKSKASRNVREISLINARPLHWLLCDSPRFWLALYCCWCEQVYWCVGVDTGLSLKPGYQFLSSASDMIWSIFFYLITTSGIHREQSGLELLACVTFWSDSVKAFRIECPMTSTLLQRLSKPANIREALENSGHVWWISAFNSLSVAVV